MPHRAVYTNVQAHIHHIYPLLGCPHLDEVPGIGGGVDTLGRGGGGVGPIGATERRPVEHARVVQDALIQLLPHLASQGRQGGLIRGHKGGRRQDMDVCGYVVTTKGCPKGPSQIPKGLSL